MTNHYGHAIIHHRLAMNPPITYRIEIIMKTTFTLEVNNMMFVGVELPAFLEELLMDASALDDSHIKIGVNSITIDSDYGVEAWSKFDEAWDISQESEFGDSPIVGNVFVDNGVFIDALCNFGHTMFDSLYTFLPEGGTDQ